MKRKHKILSGIAGIVAALIIAGCNPMKKYEEQEQDLINHYILTLGDTVYSLKPSGLYYIELEEGTGRMPIDLDTVFIRYTIKPLNGEIFDSNLDVEDDPFAFVVGNVGVLLGVNEGVHYMKNGGKAKLVIPSCLGYGTEGAYPVSGYAPLLVYLELEDVLAGPGK